MQPIRVVTAELPRILNDIIGSVLEANDDIRVVGRADNHSELRELTHRFRPDVVIMGLDEPGVAGVGWEVYAGDPLLRVLGVAGEGRQIFVYELRPHRTALGELSPEDLTATVRRLANERLAAGAGTEMRQ